MQPFGRAWDPSAKKAKPAQHLTWSNWMLEYAHNVRDENAKLIGVRRGNVGQVQVGLNVEEKDEDCWEWVEEEYTDDEEEVKPPVVPSPAAMQLDSSAPSPASQGATPAPAPAPAPAAAFANGLPSLPSTSLNTASPHPSAPVDSSLPSFPSALPGTGALPPSGASSLAGSRAATPSVAAPTPAPRPKKRRMVRVYTPIRGVYDPETNVPHVYRATQPRQVLEYVQVSKRPRLSEDASPEDEGDGGEEESEEQARLREAARKAGVASVEVVSDPRAWALEVETSRGSVEDAIASRAGKEDLLPGGWDFLELARRAGLLA